MQELGRAGSQAVMTRNTGIPHHHATKVGVGRNCVQDLVQGVATYQTITSSTRSTRNAQDDTHILVLGGFGRPLVPSIKVEVRSPVLVHATIVVIELNPDHIEPGMIQCIGRKLIRVRALRCSRDVITAIMVPLEPGTQSVHKRSIPHFWPTFFQIKIDAIEDNIPKRSGVGRSTKEHVPNLMRKVLARVTIRECVRTVGTTDGQDNDLAIVLTGPDVLGHVWTLENRSAWEGVTTMTCQIQDGNPVLDLIDKTEDKNIQGIILAVLGETAFCATLDDGGERAAKMVVEGKWSKNINERFSSEVAK